MTKGKEFFMEFIKSPSLWFGIVILVIAAFFYFPSPQYIFQMHDDYVYPAAAKQLLTEGQMHWAGGKPGIALLAAIMGAVTPYSILFLYLFFGLLTALFLFLLLKNLDISFYLAASAALLWISSPYFFYYSKTHHLVCAAFYVSGVYFCWRGLQEQKMSFYRLGSFLLGWSLLTYYLLTTYMPFLYLFFLYGWYQKGRSVVTIVLNSAIPFLMPMFIFDTAAVGVYLIWGKKTWPVTYSFFGACKWLSQTKVPVNFSIPLWVQVAYQSELFLSWLLVILIFVSLFFVMKNKNEKHLFMVVLLLPAFFWFAQHVMGGFTALRSLLGILPLFYAAILFLMSDFIPRRYQYIVLLLVIPFTGYRLYANQMNLAPQLTTAYHQVAQMIEKNSSSAVVYAGQKKLWEQLGSNKIIIPLNISNDPLEVLSNKFLWNTLVRKLHEYIEKKGSVLLVISHTNVEHFAAYKECFATEFMVTLQQTFHDNHLASLFWFAEHNIPLIQAEQNAHPWLYIFILTKK